MQSIFFSIKDKEKFQNKLLNYFSDFKYVFFFNSNNDTPNLVAISNSDKVKNNHWKVGYLAYDYKNKVEQLFSNNIDDIGFEDEFFFTPEILFNIHKDKVDIQFQSDVFSEATIVNYLKDVERYKVKPTIQKNIPIHSRISKQQYLHDVNQLKKHIQLGDIYEVNYCQEFYAKDVDLNPIDLYFKLNKKSPTPYSCFVKQEDKFLLSASPERFVKKQSAKLVTQPIKGTIKRGSTILEDDKLKDELVNNPKERSENIMIVDLVRNDLSKIAKKNSVEVDELCQIYSFAQVHQMISTVSAEIGEDVDFIKIIHALFPMGSMTGAPKIRAMELIEEYEHSKRGLFSGSVGYIKPNGDFDFNVVIRSILYNKTTKKMSYFVGSAITHLSNAEDEYEECLLKAKAINEVLGVK